VKIVGINWEGDMDGPYELQQFLSQLEKADDRMEFLIAFIEGRDADYGNIEPSSERNPDQRIGETPERGPA
jgi:hypothetical protein